MTAPRDLPMLAHVTDLKAWPGVIIGDDEFTAAEQVLETASDYIRAESGSLTRWAGDEPAPSAVMRVCVQVAARAWRNPTCASMVTVGPFSEQFQRAVEDAVFLTDVERRIVSAAVSRPKLWTLSTYRDNDGAVLAGGVSTGYRDCFTGERVPGSPYPQADSLLGGYPDGSPW